MNLKKYGGIYMEKFDEDLFDEKKIEQSLKKGKKKSILMMMMISILVFIGLNLVNYIAYSYTSKQAFESWDAYVKLSSPNSYISETRDSRGFLGGETQYKVSKDMKIKPIVIEEGQYQFGLFPTQTISRGMSGEIGDDGKDWSVSFKENGWADLLFFHPEIQYKEYKDDSGRLEEIEGNQIFELALSFDRPYNYRELPIKFFPGVNWLWVDSYHNEELKEMKEEVAMNSWHSSFIREEDALGFPIRDLSSRGIYDRNYQEFLERLKSSFYEGHHRAYDRLKDQKTDDLEILGMVVYGTKEELLPLANRDYVQAISLGGVIENY